MDISEQSWRDVDAFLTGELVEEDDALRAARASEQEHGLPQIEVAPNQGAFLALLAQVAGARRVLELGTLAGYSTIWLARAVGAQGRVTTVELDPRHADVARQNLERAGVADRVDVEVGPALEVVGRLADEGVEPYDLVFIDADKANMPAYLELALRLTRSGSVIVGDNVVRGGRVADAADDDPNVRGARAFLQAIGSDPRLDGTALQTVGSKGWDGFAVARVR
ncbi:O-methyltransferase [Isoptericola variabilis]|uniref:O-methyltransferase family 3 n=1 Tax=Isoptericola variabilis (strain 225) TaxID=743718 RepID=F6FV50_ISOV2|nr:O-methyltransferase [Isoptericola variabilis]AEG45478.1 O-methyltransferase family 3 [Isoptericola variabilis 225]TWH33834.1 putative O-methyltransferase YrrM [Isoptericola variabilis J7]